MGLVVVRDYSKVTAAERYNPPGPAPSSLCRIPSHSFCQLCRTLRRETQRKELKNKWMTLSVRCCWILYMFERLPSVLHLPGEVSVLISSSQTRFVSAPSEKNEKTHHCSGIRERPAVAFAATHLRKATDSKS